MTNNKISTTDMHSATKAEIERMRNEYAAFRSDFVRLGGDAKQFRTQTENRVIHRAMDMFDFVFRAEDVRLVDPLDLAHLYKGAAAETWGALKHKGCWAPQFSSTERHKHTKACGMKHNDSWFRVPLSCTKAA